MASGTTSSIWTPRTHADCIASLAKTPTARTRLLDWAARPGDVADPWYTGDFDATYRDVIEGCTALFERLTGIRAPELPDAGAR